LEKMFGAGGGGGGFGGGAGGGGGAFGAQQAPNYNPNNDVAVAQGPEDTISSLAWNHPAQVHMLAASSWDGKVCFSASFLTMWLL
jgi:hypothetical protein